MARRQPGRRHVNFSSTSDFGTRTDAFLNIGHLDYRDYDAANFKPQVRLRGQVQANSPPNNAILECSHNVANDGSVPGGTWTVITPVCSIANSAATFPIRESAWVDVLPTPVLSDYLFLSWRMRNTSGGGAQCRNVELEVRWVNK